MKGIDRAMPLSAEEAKTLASYGYTFAGRYYSDSAWKRLTIAEAKRISASGMYIVAIFQNANNAASLFTKAIGEAHAESAVRQAIALGQPKNTPIYFAVDFEADTAAELEAVHTYFTAIVERLKGTGYTAGVYGSYTVVSFVATKVAGVMFKFQTKAWSNKKQLPSANLYQKACDCPLPERPSFGNVDLVDSNGAGGGFKIK